MESNNQDNPVNALCGDTTTKTAVTASSMVPSGSSNTAEFLKVLHPEGACFEIRALAESGGAYSAIFTNPDQAAAYVQGLERDCGSGGCKGIYTTLNPVKCEAVGDRTKRAIEDCQIASRANLLIDLDPKRASSTNSTDAELELAVARGDAIETFLQSQGWPVPLKVMSGNGCHLLYRIDLPADDGGLVQRALQGLSAKFSDAQVNLDIGVCNPSRITKLVGTTARKGERTAERPQRMALWQNAHLTARGVVTREQLEAVAAIVPQNPVQRLSADGQAVGGSSPQRFVNMSLPQLKPIVDGCAFIRHCRDDAANLSEPHWHAGLSIIGRCKDGESHAHEFSQPHPGYEQAKTQAKLKHALEGAGPRTCRSIEDDLGFGGCAECPHRGKITSPIQLGRVGHDLLGLPLNDDGNAERFVLRCGDRFRFCVEQQRWYAWDGIRWVKDDFGRVRLAMVEVMREFQDGARALGWTGAGADNQTNHGDSPTHPADRRVHARREGGGSPLSFAIKSANTANVENALKQARDRLIVSERELDADPWLFNVRNGTIDLRTGTLRPHDPGDLITRLAPVMFDPQAKSELWENHLLTVMGRDQDLVGYLQKVLGYGLSGSTCQHEFYVALGRGRNGKTVTLEAQRAMMGDYAINTPATTFLASAGRSDLRNDVARLAGARFVTTSETTTGARIDTAMVKSITGGETMTARFLHCEHFDFVPRFKLFLATNEAPEVPAHDMAIWERLRVLPFTVTIPAGERDLHLLEKLTAPDSLSGILAWAVQGCLRWQTEGLIAPDAVRLATEAYRSEMDDVGAFLEECCDVDRNNAAFRVRPGDLLRAYTAWAAARGESAITQKTLSARMSAKGHETRRTNGTRAYWGIRLKPCMTDAKPMPVDQLLVERMDAEDVVDQSAAAPDLVASQAKQRKASKAKTVKEPDAQGKPKKLAKGGGSSEDSSPSSGKEVHAPRKAA